MWCRRMRARARSIMPISTPAGTYANTDKGISVFSGPVDDPFFIDLGAAFDTANFRLLEGGPPHGTGVPGVLSATEDAANENFASDTVSGYAVDVIAIQVPIASSPGRAELSLQRPRPRRSEFGARRHDRR